MHPPERDWMIVAPWWQWTDPATVPPGQPVTPDPLSGRLSRPIFQKYDSPGLVNDFIKDPQRCLAFVDDDLVHAVRDVSTPSANPAGKLYRINARRDGASIVDQAYVPDGTDTRKIFLDTHKRFYLVVCDIRCDGPGFPKAGREKVCKAGFVVRRRTVKPPSCSVKAVTPILKTLASTRTKLARVNQLTAIEQAALESAGGAGRGLESAKLESLLKTRTSLQQVIAQEKQRFDGWVARFGVMPRLQGWFPSDAGASKVGCWRDVDEMPEEPGDESSFPLYPLIPDRNDPRHAGQFGTIYFGILPTSSHDCDGSGHARFDDQEYYEVRCWTLRHLTPHDPDQPCPCPDRYFWSLPSRPYRLAAHFDLTGTSHQPVTIQMPDLNALAAQATPTLGLGVAKPPGSLMLASSTDGTPKKKGRSTGFEICFLPIPLITIVAMFVFELFLPVVMFLFQLWWMLALKFCIPPEISVSAGISAEIGLGGSIGISADASVNATVEASIAADVTASIQAEFDPDTANALLATYSPIALANMEIGAAAAQAALDAQAAGKPAPPAAAQAPSVAADVSFEPEVVHA